MDFIPWQEKAIFLFCSISCQIESKVNVASQSPRGSEKAALESNSSKLKKKSPAHARRGR